MEYIWKVFVVFFFIWLSHVLALVTNVARNKQVHCGSSFYSDNCKQFVNGNLKDFVKVDTPTNLVIDLKREYGIIDVRLAIGNQFDVVTVSLLKSFDEKIGHDMSSSNICGHYENLGDNNIHRIECVHIESKHRYVHLWANSTGRYGEIAELEVYSDNRVDFSLQYHGCYESFVGGHKEVFSLEECLNHCKKSSHTYTGVQNGGECVCIEVLSKLVASSACHMRCLGDNHACGGLRTMSVYETKECVKDEETLVQCLRYCEDKKCHLCAFDSRDPRCSKVSCGSESCEKCLPFQIGNTTLTECVCPEGSANKNFYYDSCQKEVYVLYLPKTREFIIGVSIGLGVCILIICILCVIYRKKSRAALEIEKEAKKNGLVELTNTTGNSQKPKKRESKSSGSASRYSIFRNSFMSNRTNAADTRYNMKNSLYNAFTHKDDTSIYSCVNKT